MKGANFLRSSLKDPIQYKDIGKFLYGFGH